jgi:hypothetical protein
VGFDGGEVGLEGGGAGVVGGGVDVVHVVLEGHLGVDDDAAVFGEADDGVGLEAAAAVGGGADLEVEVAALGWRPAASRRRSRTSSPQLPRACCRP